MQGEQLRKGPWLQEEDEQLIFFVTRLGERRWDSLAKVTGLRRSGKSCRLRWMNYLRPNLKHGPFSAEEERLIFQLQQQWGNKWSKIARCLPGRTDNEIKNYWRTHLKKKTQAQQEGGVQYKVDNARTDEKSSELVSQDYNYSDSYRPETYTFPLSDWELTSSPHEIWISDWIEELQTDQTETEHQHIEQDSNSSCTESSYDSYNRMRFGNNYDTWDYAVAGSLWDMN
ncbi:hypothetical protein L6164_033730 [Bauhinia variegata]|uniref:Uncharacterized protein n=1 Tax=Bauhinia variegata TaxID=167791 RepID=A0ACB9KSQ3_BAUVA|nr:hypothetical protein L6164_033730 [Bauhinia variegata]